MDVPICQVQITPYPRKKPYSISSFEGLAQLGPIIHISSADGCLVQLNSYLGRKDAYSTICQQ